MDKHELLYPAKPISGCIWRFSDGRFGHFYIFGIHYQRLPFPETKVSGRLLVHLRARPASLALRAAAAAQAPDAPQLAAAGSCCCECSCCGSCARMEVAMRALQHLACPEARCPTLHIHHCELYLPGSPRVDAAAAAHRTADVVPNVRGEALPMNC